MTKAVLRTCGKPKCAPRFRMVGGADHFGLDVFVRCMTCSRRTETHVECIEPTEEIERIVADEWKRELAA